MKRKSGWKVYWWKAGKQLLIGDRRRIVDLMGLCFTVRYTESRRPKTLTYICELEDFLPQAARIGREASRYAVTK